MFIAIDPHKAFKMMELEFREGNPEDAERMLADGRKVTLTDGMVIHGTVEKRPNGDYAVTTWNNEVRVVPAGRVKSDEDWQYIVVTEEFRQLKGLGVGDSLELRTTAGKMKEFTIAGAVWSPGIDVMVSMHDMNRQFDQRTAASVFGSLEDGRKYFGIKRVFLFAANLENYVEKEALLKNIRKQLNQEGMSVGDVRHIKHNIVQSFQKLLMLASTVAFAALAVASLGVTNTVMASVRSRRWQFGVLRSIGVTRSQLVRLVLAEAMLLGIVGVALGLAAGFEMTVNANQLSARITGYNPDIAVPWGIVSIGVGVVLAISLLASLWPAASVARREPLSLLQAGRASA
jgi:putative ABC transport system permease protein